MNWRKSSNKPICNGAGDTLGKRINEIDSIFGLLAEHDHIFLTNGSGVTGKSAKSLHTIGDPGNTTTHAVAKMHSR